MKKEEVITNYRANAYMLSRKVLTATSDELRYITEWEEYRETLAAKETLEKIEF